jgi:hypothetical protein
VTSDARPLSALISDAAGNLGDVVRGEIRLGYAKLANAGVSMRRGAIWLAVAGGCALLGLGYLSVAAVFALSLVLSVWAAALSLGAISLVAAGIAALVARRVLKRAHGLPRTLATIKETTRWPLQSKS